MKSTFRKPSLKSCLNQAEKLVASHGRRNPDALNLIKYNHGRFSECSPIEIAERKFSLRDAQTVVARIQGYSGWSALKRHVVRLNQPRPNLTLAFEQACQAVVEGQIDLLRHLLDQHSGLVRARSDRSHRCTLLHYIAANGIEHDRQKTPANAVAIARLLLQRGADPDALAATYGGGNAQTTLSLLVSSCWPAEAGIQDDLVRLLCKFGALPDGLDGQGLPLVTALVFFYHDTAGVLARCGARLDHLLAAAAVGSQADVERCFTRTGRLKSTNRVYIGFQLRPPTDRLEMLGQAFVYAAMCNNLKNMILLHERYRCPVDALADRGIRALHLAAYKGHRKVVRWLLDQGADPALRDNQWNSTAVTWAWQASQQEICNEIIRSMDLTLHQAVNFFRPAEVKRLLSAASDPERLANQSDSDGLKPIHFLHDDTQNGDQIVGLLVEAGADLNALDPGGRTAVDRLSVMDRPDLVSLLRRFGGKRARELASP